MECGPTAKTELENVAFPLLRVPVPNTVAPSLNVTVPGGVPLPGATAATVAVNVTDCPNTEATVDGATAVVVLPFGQASYYTAGRKAA